MGVLKARVGGSWVEITGNSEEVFVGPEPPPGAEELWFDTDGIPSVPSQSPYYPCTSGTRPTTPYAGLQIYEADTKKIRVWDGAGWVQVAALGAWDSWAPTITWTNTTLTYANWTRSGRRITGDLKATCTGVPAGGNFSFPLPVACRYSDHPVGTWRGGAFTFDQNGAIRTGGDTITVFFEDDVGALLSSAVAGIGSGDSVAVHFDYEAAASF